MLILNAHYIDGTYRLVEGDIRIENSRVVQLGHVLVPFSDEEILLADNLLIIPALADCHIHTPDTLMRGLFRDMALSDWCGDSPQGRLQKQAFDYLDNAVGSEDFHTLVLHGYLQYVRQGVGFVVESGQADGASMVLQQGMEEIGLKGVVDLYIDTHPRKSRPVSILHGTHVPEEEDLDADSLAEAIAASVGISLDGGCHPIMTHCLETVFRRQEVLRKFGASTVEVLRRNALLGPGTLLFHCVQVDEADIATIGSTGTLVVHCPVSNLWSGAGRMPLVPMLAQGIPILLGTDFLQHDFWEVMRTAYYGLKEQSMGCYGINDVFAMATTNAEHIGGSSLYKGVVREGAPADLTFIRMDDCLKPLVEVPGFSNSLHNVITQTKPDMVRHLMVDGKWIMRDRKVLTVDEDSIEAGYRRICGNLFPNCLNSMA